MARLQAEEPLLGDDRAVSPHRYAGHHSPTAWAARRNLHYGWVMVGVTVLIVLVSAAVRAAPTVLIRPLEADFDWSRGQISLALSLSLLFYGFASPLSGKMCDRFGIRGTSLAFLVVSLAGVLLSLLVTHLWQLHLFWGLVVGLGTGGVAVVMSASVANTWFEQRRGLVTGILGGASSAGNLVFLPVLVVVIGQWGWRAGVAVLALALGALVLPAALLLLRSRPHDIGLTPYGSWSGSRASVVDDRVTPMRVALRTGDFWLLSLSYSVCGFTTLGLVGMHFVPHAVEHGFSETQAAGILSLMGGLNIFGTIFSGWLCDRFSPRKLLATYYLLRAAALLVLPFVTTLPLMTLFAVAFGLDYIATVPPMVLLTAERFGRRSFGTIYGWITFVHMLGGAIAATLAGTIHDAAGNYTLAIYLSSILALGAGALAWSINRRPIAAPATAMV